MHATVLDRQDMGIDKYEVVFSFFPEISHLYLGIWHFIFIS